MRLTPTLWRRIAGAAVLGAALLMLAGGQTVLRPALSGAGYVVYWLACLGLVALALSVALLDLWIVRRQARQEQIALWRRMASPGSGPPPAGRSGPAVARRAPGPAPRARRGARRR